MVWPKLRMRRRPSSRSSLVTTSALIAQHSVITGSSASGDAIEQRVHVAGAAREQRRRRDHAVLDHFVQPGPQFPAAERGEHRRVHGHQRRLVEGAQQVLAEPVVDADLAADRAVGLRHDGGGHVHQADAAKVAGRGKAGQIADDPAADDDQHGLAVDAARDQRVVHLAERRHRLGLLAIVDEHRRVVVAVAERQAVPDGRADAAPRPSGSRRPRGATRRGRPRRWPRRATTAGRADRGCATPAADRVWTSMV